MKAFGQVGGVALEESSRLVVGDHDLRGAEQLEHGRIQVVAEPGQVEIVDGTRGQVLTPEGDGVGPRSKQPGALQLDLGVVDHEHRGEGQTLGGVADVDDSLGGMAVEGDALGSRATGDEGHAEVDRLLEEVEGPAAGDAVEIDLLVGSIVRVGLVEVGEGSELLDDEDLRIDLGVGPVVPAKAIERLPADAPGAPAFGAVSHDGSKTKARLAD